MLSSFFFAHEVYVLTPEQIERGWDQQLLVWQTLSTADNFKRFIIGLIFVAAILAIVLFLKSTSTFRKIGSFIDKATVAAPDVIRVAFGTSLIFAALEKSLYGPELPFDLFPAGSLFQPLLLLSGIALIMGIFNRWIAAAMAGLWVLAFVNEGIYMLNYINYLGEAVAVILLPDQRFSFDRWLNRKRRVKDKTAEFAEKYSFPIARILFGFSIIFAAVQVKMMHTTLSYEVVTQYRLTDYFHFDPLFVVLGAALIESLIGILYILGLLIRFNTIVFLTFLILSITFFKETVWPHYLLIGLGVGMFLHRPDKLALDRYLFAGKDKKK